MVLWARWRAYFVCTHPGIPKVLRMHGWLAHTQGRAHASSYMCRPLPMCRGRGRHNLMYACPLLMPDSGRTLDKSPLELVQLIWAPVLVQVILCSSDVHGLPRVALPVLFVRLARPADWMAHAKLHLRHPCVGKLVFEEWGLRESGLHSDIFI